MNRIENMTLKDVADAMKKEAEGADDMMMVSKALWLELAELFEITDGNLEAIITGLEALTSKGGEG